MESSFSEQLAVKAPFVAEVRFQERFGECSTVDFDEGDAPGSVMQSLCYKFFTCTGFAAMRTAVELGDIGRASTSRTLLDERYSSIWYRSPVDFSIERFIHRSFLQPVLVRWTGR